MKEEYVLIWFEDGKIETKFFINSEVKLETIRDGCKILDDRQIPYKVIRLVHGRFDYHCKYFLSELSKEDIEKLPSERMFWDRGY